ncbi:MAG: hypothetical protein ACREO5_06415 [Candidatus Binatia bacterium]
MRAFYNACHNYSEAATAITGSAAFISLFGSGFDWITKFLTGVVAAASTANLVFQFPAKAELHDDLCRRFTDLAARIELWPATPENCAKARADRLQIEKDEPTERRLVDLLAFNEEARSRGISADRLVPLSRLQRIFGYICTFGMGKIENWYSSQSSIDARRQP